MKSPWIAAFDPAPAPGPTPNPRPEWRYRVQALQPSFASTDVLPLPADHPMPTAADLVAEAKNYPEPDILARMQKAPVVKMNNLCEVRFTGTPADRKVIQDMWTRTDFAHDPPTWSKTTTEAELTQPPIPRMPGE